MSKERKSAKIIPFPVNNIERLGRKLSPVQDGPKCQIIALPCAGYSQTATPAS